MTNGFKRLPLFLSLVCFSIFAYAQQPEGPLQPVISGAGFKLNCEHHLLPRTELSHGPSYFFQAVRTAKSTLLQDIPQATFLSYNVLNLIESPGTWVKNPNGPSTWQYGALQKSSKKTALIAKTIEAHNPLIATLIEVESMHALNSFDQEYPNMRRYTKILVPGNDKRGINIAFLVRNDLYANIKFESHISMTHEYLGKTEKIMSRDFPVLLFFDPHQPQNSMPVLIYAGVHLKSQRDTTYFNPRRVDSESTQKREAQAIAMREILDEYQSIYPQTPIIFGGDFNKDIPQGREFETLYHGGYRSVFDLLKVPKEARKTHCYFEPNAPVKFNQLDDFRVDSKTASSGTLVDVAVIPDRDAHGNILGPPQSYQERKNRPSDHLAIRLVVRMKELLQVAKKWASE